MCGCSKEKTMGLYTFIYRSSVVRAFAHGAMGRRIDPSWGEPTGLFLVPASAPSFHITVNKIC